MKSIIGCSLILFFGLTLAQVYADDLEDGLGACHQKDYKTALEKLRPFAEQGNAGAQFLIVFLHFLNLTLLFKP